MKFYLSGKDYILVLKGKYWKRYGSEFLRANAFVKKERRAWRILYVWNPHGTGILVYIRIGYIEKKSNKYITYDKARSYENEKCLEEFYRISDAMKYLYIYSKF